MKFNSITEEDKSILNTALLQYIRRETDGDKIKVALDLMDRIASTEE